MTTKIKLSIGVGSIASLLIFVFAVEIHLWDSFHNWFVGILFDIALILLFFSGNLVNYSRAKEEDE